MTNSLEKLCMCYCSVLQNGQTVLEVAPPKYQAATGADAAAAADSASSPTPGVLERVLVNKGDKVTELDSNLSSQTEQSFCNCVKFYCTIL